MANIASARKRARQAVKKRAHNMSLRSRMRTYVKRVRAAIDAGDKDAATTAYAEVVSSLDGSTSKGIIHANNAARKKSRLNAQIKAL